MSGSLSHILYWIGFFGKDVKRATGQLCIVVNFSFLSSMSEMMESSMTASAGDGFFLFG